MIIDCISDLHGFEPNLPGGDLLILCGDYTKQNKPVQWANFFCWLSKQLYEKKILVAGNHDNFLKSAFPKNQKEAEELKEVESFLEEQKEIEKEDFEYLCDSGTEFKGLKIWGTPWTPWFHGVNPKCKAFMDSESCLDKHYSDIPNDIDILICHGPMKHMLDTNIDGYACGSSSLRKHVDRVRPDLFIFGHIHEQGGNQLMYKHHANNTWCVNCSYVNERYQPVNKPVRVSF